MKKITVLGAVFFLTFFSPSILAIKWFGGSSRPETRGAPKAEKVKTEIPKKGGLKEKIKNVFKPSKKKEGFEEKFKKTKRVSEKIEDRTHKEKIAQGEKIKEELRYITTPVPVLGTSDLAPGKAPLAPPLPLYPLQKHVTPGSPKSKRQTEEARRAAEPEGLPRRERATSVYGTLPVLPVQQSVEKPARRGTVRERVHAFEKQSGSQKFEAPVLLPPPPPPVGFVPGPTVRELAKGFEKKASIGK